MNKNYNRNVFNSIIAGLLIILYLSIGFIPNLSAVDKIAPQWIFMTILNGVGLVFLAYNHGFYSRSIKLTLRSYMTLTYIGFIFWASLSYFYAINPTEVIVNITRQANVLLMYMLIGIFLFSIKEKIQFICWAIVVILSIEVYAVIIEAKSMIDLTGFISSGSLKGVTANRNITAFSIAIKIPFILFFISSNKKKSFYWSINYFDFSGISVSIDDSVKSLIFRCWVNFDRIHFFKYFILSERKKNNLFNKN